MPSLCGEPAAGSGGPYLSIVATSRNDDHGGNLLARMQVFVDGLMEQCRRHDLDTELILVEWNPPPHRPRLADALRWPCEPSPCTVRIIEVPPRVHAEFRHSESLPLFQMIAKNVGIRRARGRFVLVTNIDILFSDELMARLARRNLKPHRLYRIDRYDACADVPVDAPVTDKLAFSRENVIRINKRRGTYYPATGRFDSIYPSRLHLVLRTVASPVLPLLVAVPYLRLLPDVLRGLANRRHPPLYGIRRFVRLRRRAAVPPSGFVNSVPAVALWLPLFSLVRHERRKRRRNRHFRRLRRFIAWQRRRINASAADRPVVERLFIARKVLGAVGRTYARVLRDGWRAVAFEFRRGRLHTNACGDFTLLARERWFSLRGYAEFQMYSFHIDSLLCHAAVCGGAKETVFTDPARIYHVEHGEGSGFTPEGRQRLWTRMETSGIRRLGDGEFWDMVVAMRRRSRRTIFNDQDWGLAGHHLAETDPMAHPDRSDR